MTTQTPPEPVPLEPFEDRMSRGEGYEICVFCTASEIEPIVRDGKREALKMYLCADGCVICEGCKQEGRHREE